MQRIKYLLLLLLINEIVVGQQRTVQTSPKPVNPYAQVDKLALALPDSMAGSTASMAKYFKANFTTDTKLTRALFI